MNISRIADARSLRPDGSLWREIGERAGALAPILGVIAAAAFFQPFLTTTTDVSWLITLSERILAGQTPYVDFLELNPPASLLLYLAPVAVARLTGAAPEFMVAAFGFA